MPLFDFFRRRRPARPASPHAGRRARPRPQLECLEDRVALATFTVVDPQVANMTTTFPTFALALNAAAATGDVIQIDPGTQNPSGLNPITVNKAVTIQASPAAAGPANLPQYSFTVATSNVALTNLNLGSVLVNASLTNVRVQNSLITGNSTTQFGVSTTGGTLISGNSFFTSNANAPANVALTAGTNNQVLFNSFVSIVNTNAFPGAAGTVKALIRGVNQTSGMLIQSNTLIVRDPSAVSQGINLIDCGGAGTAVGTVAKNTIHLAALPPPAAATNSIGVFITDSTTAGNRVNLRVLDNTFNTDFRGTGLATVRTNLGNQGYQVELAGNNFVSNLVGLFVQGTGTASAAAFGTIDAGGGPLSSAGGNDFLGFQGQTVLPSNPAIQTRNNSAGGGPTVQALNNLFSPFTPTGVIDAELGTVVTSSPFTSGFPATLTIMFHDYLERLPSAGEVSAFTGLNNTQGITAVARTVVRSTESAALLVQRRYRELLGRPADATGLTNFVALLQAGGTDEQVITSLAASPEYYNRAAQSYPGGDPNTSWVRALYRDLLGRAAAANEVQAWINALPTLGLSGIASTFTGSSEFRTLQVRALYGQINVSAVQSPNLLHRRTAPSAAEVSGWVGSGLSLLDIQITFLSSSEFATNG